MMGEYGDELVFGLHKMERDYHTLSLNAFAALKTGVFDAAIVITSPVAGFRPWRSSLPTRLTDFFYNLRREEIRSVQYLIQHNVGQHLDLV